MPPLTPISTTLPSTCFIDYRTDPFTGVGENRNQPVFGVPGIVPRAELGHIAIVIVNGLDGTRVDVGVLVQFVGLVQVRDLIDARGFLGMPPLTSHPPPPRQSILLIYRTDPFPIPLEASSASQRYLLTGKRRPQGYFTRLRD